MYVALPFSVTYIAVMKLCLFLCLFFSATAFAEVYRWVDENGQTVFSDQPAKNAEMIELPEGSSYTPSIKPLVTDVTEAENETEGDKSESLPSAPRYQLLVASPQDDETLRVNNGNLTVNLQIRPALSQQRNDKIQLQLDGRPYGQPQAQLSFNLPNLDRGTHQLSAHVINVNGEKLAQSDTITFHLQRNSILLNPRTRNTPPANAPIRPAPQR